jgi:hypothetical protein
VRIAAASCGRRGSIRSLRLRQRSPTAVITQAGSAQLRFHRRDRRVAARGKFKQQIVTAIARKLSGFLWAALSDLIGRRRKDNP